MNLLAFGAYALAAAVQDPVPELVPTVLFEHQAQVSHIALDAKGKTLATAEVGIKSPDNKINCTIRAWDLKKEEERWQAEYFSPIIIDIGAGTDFLAVNIGFGSFSGYDLRDGEAEQGIGGPLMMEKFLCIAVDPKDRWLWLGSQKGSIMRLIPDDVKGWSTRKVENNGTYSLAMDSKGKQLAIGGKDGSVRFADPVGGQVDKKKSFEAHTSAVTALSFDPKGSRIVAGAEDGAICMLEVSRGKRVFDIAGHSSEICALAIDGKRKWIAAGDKSGVVTLWEYKTGERAATISGTPEGPVAGLVFADKGKRLIGSTGGENVLAWDLSEL